MERTLADLMQEIDNLRDHKLYMRKMIGRLRTARIQGNKADQFYYADQLATFHRIVRMDLVIINQIVMEMAAAKGAFIRPF